LRRKIFLAILPIAIFLLAWEVSARLEWVNPVLFPAPSAILNELVDLFQEGLPAHSILINHTLATLKRLGIGFSAGVLAGVLMGVLMGLSNPSFHFFNPLILVLMSIPGIALAPLFIIWLGFGDPTIITLGALSTFFPVVYSTTTGVRSVDRQMVRAAQIMGASRLQVITSVYIPWSAAFVFNGIKLGLARGWMTVIAVEFVAASNYGLGYMIWYATERLKADVVYAGILVMILIYFILDKLLIGNVEKKTISRWGMITQKQEE
jgi:ABC-type nitrate/sulfonate/bicarbonate transport system permease component